MNKIFKIYKIEFPSNKVYIGQTCDYKSRWREHLLDAASGIQRKVYNAMRKYKTTLENFSIIEDNILSKEEANAREIYYIELYDSFKNGYNSTPGGDGFQLYGENHPMAKLSDEQILNIRIIRASKLYTMSEVYKFYETEMSYSGFEKIWNYETRKEIGEEYNTEELHKFYKKFTKTVGQAHGNSKLTNEQVIEIRNKYWVDGIKMEDIWEDFKDLYSLSGFRKVVLGSTYKNVPMPQQTEKCSYKKKLTKEQVLLIREKYESGMKITEIIEKWFSNYSESAIYLIATRQRYKNY